MNCRVEPRIRDDKFDRFCGAGDHCELTELSGQVHVFTGDSLLLRLDRLEGTAWATRYWQGYVCAGRVQLCRGAEIWTDPRDVAIFSTRTQPSRFNWSTFTTNTGLGPVGFDHVELTNTTGYSHVRWQLTLPDWLLVAAAAAFPALRLRRQLRASVYGPGQCAGCGYDLRATPAQCPECGRPAGAAA